MIFHDMIDLILGSIPTIVAAIVGDISNVDMSNYGMRRVANANAEGPSTAVWA